MAKRQAQDLVDGTRVRIKKKSRVVDKDRINEGFRPGEPRPEIDQDVTGREGVVCGSPYDSPLKDGERCVPIRLAGGAVISVPENRLGRTSGESVSRAGWSRSWDAAWDRFAGKTRRPKGKKKR